MSLETYDIEMVHGRPVSAAPQSRFVRDVRWSPRMSLLFILSSSVALWALIIVGFALVF